MEIRWWSCIGSMECIESVGSFKSGVVVLLANRVTIVVWESYTGVFKSESSRWGENRRWRRDLQGKGKV